MKTLFDLIRPIPADRTAIVIPESNLKVSYGAFRDQVTAVAEALAAAGIGRGDRVGIALPNGLPMIVAFLAAAMAGTAAPLNPGYKEDEFRFFLEDTDARVLHPAARGRRRGARAAGDSVPVLPIDMDAERRGRPRRRRRRAQLVHAAAAGRRRADPAHQRQHRPAEARAAGARQPVDLGAATSRAATTWRPTTWRCA